MNDSLLLEVRDGIATLTLNRPAALNALDGSMKDALVETVPAIESDPKVRVVVIRGAGDHFMAGGDLKGFHGRLDQDPEVKRRHFAQTINRLHPVIVSLRRMPQPVIASVSGAAAGFGLSLMMAADLVVAGDNASFTLAYCRIGTSPDGGGSFHLPRIVGLRKAMEIALLGDSFDAETAARLGLVNFLVPAAKLEAETAKLAARLAAGPAEALARTKALLRQSLDNGFEAQLQAEADNFAACAASADFAEGVRAFVEKRKPRFGQS